MKLKYYLRGIGVGIILTAVVFCIANQKEKLSDEEIIRRAASLGMVMKEDDDGSLDKLIGEIKPSTTAESITPAQAVKDEDSMVTEPAVTVTPDITAIPDVTVTPDMDTQPKEPEDTDENDEADKLPQPEEDKADEEQHKLQEEEAQTEEISFTIERGMSSKTVARLLEEKGLIDDAENFNDYIIAQGKAAVIRTGSYSLPKGSSYREILNEITG